MSIVRFAEGEEVELTELSELSGEELLLVLSSDETVELSSEELTALLPDESEELVVLSSDELLDSDVTEEVVTDDVEEEEESFESPPAGISHAARTRTREKNPMERIFFIGMNRENRKCSNGSVF